MFVKAIAAAPRTKSQMYVRIYPKIFKSEASRDEKDEVNNEARKTKGRRSSFPERASPARRNANIPALWRTALIPKKMRPEA